MGAFYFQFPPMRHLPLLLILLLAACTTKQDTHLFTQLDKTSTGIDFQNTLYDGEALNVINYIYFYNGGGVAIGDINNDGLPDILFTGNMVHNRLFLNKGNFQFEDITEKSGIATPAFEGWATGATMADVNGDGKMDIYICRSADGNPARRKNLLFINNGPDAGADPHSAPSFTEKAAEYGLADEGFSTQAAFFDYDKDGDLDLFLINHSLHQYTTGAVDNPGWRKESQPAFECKLYRNDWNDSLHHPVYTDVSTQAGIHSDVLTFGLGLAISDLNNDGWPDVYVSNDFNEPDYLFINNGPSPTATPGSRGPVTFTERLGQCMDQTSLYSMGNDAADFNNDGLVDLMTLDMLPEDNHTQKMHSGAENFNKFQALFHRGFYYQYSRNMLQKNNGDGTFSEIGQLAGISNTNWSWSALFSDFDNDGNKDLLVTNGYVRDYTDMDFLRYSADNAMHANTGDKEAAIKDAISKMPQSPDKSYLYHNNGNNTFTRINNEWGLTRQTVSAGAAYVDLNNDGALDLVINNTNEYAGIYRNNARNNPNNHYLKVQLKGNPRNSTGIGSKIKLFCKDTVYYQEAFPVRGFQSSVDPVLNFGIGAHQTIDSILVIWPDDHYEIIKAQTPDTTLRLKQESATQLWQYASPAKPFLTAVNTPTPVHTENSFNDFDQQPLLINYLSRRGPVMAKAADLIFIGGAVGHPGQLFRQTATGALIRQPFPTSDSLQDDGAALFFDVNGDGHPDLLITAGGYELPADAQPRLYLNDGKDHFKKANTTLPPINSSCIKAADIDGDGDGDLFVGGGPLPNQYPRTSPSHLFLNDGKGNFTATDLSLDGLITSAIFLDVNNDHQPDLIVAGEWMPVKVYLNNHGHFTDASDKYIRFPSTGWWNTLDTADLNGDGRPDLIVGNQGLNNQFTASAQHPLSLYYKDFNHNNTIDPIFCYYIGDTSYPAISRDDLTGKIPALKKRFLEYHSYADATINDLFAADELKDAGQRKAETLATSWLENKGEAGFVLHPLPQEAQYGPVYAIAATDINGDGHPDLLLAGGNQWTRIRFGRYRANHGVLLLNDGKGNFTYIPQSRSGLQLRDDVRGVLPLANKQVLFGVNDGPAKLYRYE